MGESCADEEYFRYLCGRSRWALLYRRHFQYPRLRRHLVGRVLDVGCGIGDFLASYPGAVGVDINPFTVELCRRRGLEAHRGEEGKFPFESRSFESVVMDNVLEHLEDPLPTLKEVLRLLRPGGRILIGVPGRRGYEEDASHRHFYDVPGLKALMRSQGCTTRRVFGMPFSSKWLDRAMSQYCVYGVFETLPSSESA